jgi:hypothetical protein
MIFKKPFWQRPFVMLLLIALAVGGGVWLALDRPLPEGWFDGNGAPELRLPEFLRQTEPDRLFCAESPETGFCRCITASGQRPEISEAECRRRARESTTDPD